MYLVDIVPIIGFLYRYQISRTIKKIELIRFNNDIDTYYNIYL